MFLNKETLMLTLKVGTPINREFELMSRLLKDFHALSISESHKFCVYNRFESFNKVLIIHFCKEFNIIGSMLESIAYAIFDEILCQLHIVVDVVERNLRLNHPELRQVARSVGILGAERRSERIDCAESRCSKLALKLSGNSKAGRLSEEILRIVHLALFVLRDVVEVKRCHLKHRAGTLAVARCDERRVEIEETTVVEEFVDCISQRVAYAEHRAESVCARTQMSLLAQEFESVSFFLQRISLRIGSAVDFKRFRLHLGSLTLALRLHEFAFYVDARTSCDGFQILIGEFLHIEDNLKVLYCRAVVESHKLHMLVAAARAHPAFHTNVCANQLRRPYF